MIFFSSQPIDLSMCNIELYVFQLNEDGPSSENLEEETENIVAANHWVLPAGICDSNSRWRTPRTRGWRTAHISTSEILCVCCVVLGRFIC